MGRNKGRSVCQDYICNYLTMIYLFTSLYPLCINFIYCPVPTQRTGVLTDDDSRSVLIVRSFELYAYFLFSYLPLAG